MGLSLDYIATLSWQFDFLKSHLEKDNHLVGQNVLSAIEWVPANHSQLI